MSIVSSSEICMYREKESRSETFRLKGHADIIKPVHLNW